MAAFQGNKIQNPKEKLRHKTKFRFERLQPPTQIRKCDPIAIATKLCLYYTYVHKYVCVHLYI